MTELDFEELDKAVSDLMKDTDSEPTNDQTATPVVPVVPVVTPAQSTAGDTPQLTGISTPVQAVEAPAVARARGRFMDFRPKNGAMPAVQSTTPVIPVSSESSEDIPPPAESAPEEPTAPSAVNVGEYAADPAAVREPLLPAAESAENTTESEAETATEDTITAPVFTMPDPIDVATSSEEKHEDELATVITPEADSQGEKPEIEQPAEVAENDEPKNDGESEPEVQPAMDSPFIPDAKVEKRPLGGTPAEPAEANAQDDSAAAPEGSQPTVAPLPRELDSDLMNLETDANNVPPAADETQAEKVPEQPQKEAEQPAVAAPADVAQPGAIFDTDTYHNMPVAAPVKKKHGWMVVVWIIVLLIVGACAGAAYFYFTTQQ